MSVKKIRSLLRKDLHLKGFGRFLKIDSTVKYSGDLPISMSHGRYPKSIRVKICQD